VSRDSELPNLNEKYISYWIENKKLLAEHGFKISKLKTLYVGGGTPSLWGDEGISFLSQFMKEFSFKSEYEFTLEVDPGTITEKQLNSWIKLGVNRFSLGIQSISQTFLKILDRRHSKEDILDLLTIFQRKKLNYSVDLIIGAPYSKEEKRNIINEIKELVIFGPSHFSVYILKPHGAYPLKKFLPSDEYIENEYLTVCKTLSTLGFSQYEVSNFSKKNLESQHNLRYWSSESVAALGPNATGFLKTDNKTAIRYSWKTTKSQAKIEKLSKEELKLEEIYLKLRTKIGIKKSDFINNSSFDELRRNWISLGVCESQGENVVLNSKGLVILDSLMDSLFRLNLI